MVRQTPSKMQKGTPQILPNTSDQLLHCNKAILQLFTITTWRLPLHGHIWSIIPGIYNWHTFTCMRRMRAGTCLQHTHTEGIELCVDACVCVHMHTHRYVYIYYIYMCVCVIIYIYIYTYIHTTKKHYGLRNIQYSRPKKQTASAMLLGLLLAGLPKR